MESSVSRNIIRVNSTCPRKETDLLAVEEPLEISLRYGLPPTLKNLAVTMRTPSNDAELALGFLFTEGIISHPSEIKSIEQSKDGCLINDGNRIMVVLHEHIIPNILNTERNFYTTSSCGVCGKASINAIRVLQSSHIAFSQLSISADVINSMPDKVGDHQKVFADTGGLHAATLFSPGGNLLLLREDVGRHNALDKLIGASLNVSNIDLSQCILLLSGRASFELIQKAAMAKIPVICAIGAPSSLAVSLAEEFGITLIGFLRNNRFNIYSGANRIQLPIHENTY